jgi:hypothetical protein
MKASSNIYEIILFYKCRLKKRVSMLSMGSQINQWN